jgi:hypothetical protein
VRRQQDQTACLANHHRTTRSNSISNTTAMYPLDRGRRDSPIMRRRRHLQTAKDKVSRADMGRLLRCKMPGRLCRVREVGLGRRLMEDISHIKGPRVDKVWERVEGRRITIGRLAGIDCLG